jgi:hypothetical protein
MQAAIGKQVSNFLSGGSLLVYGNTANSIGQETAPSAMSGYGRAQLEAELQLVEKMAAKAGTRSVSLGLPNACGVRSLQLQPLKKRRLSI